MGHSNSESAGEGREADRKRSGRRREADLVMFSKRPSPDGCRAEWEIPRFYTPFQSNYPGKTTRTLFTSTMMHLMERGNGNILAITRD